MIFNEDHHEKDEQNFWIAYADLMAGLLFVFILLIGAIVIKYVFIQTDLQAIRADLQKEKEALGMSEDALADKKERLKAVKERLTTAREENIHLAFELNRLQEQYTAEQAALKLSKAESAEHLQQLQMHSAQSADRLRQIQKREAEIATKIEQISLNTVEIEKLKRLLFDYELHQKTLQEINQQLQAKNKNIQRSLDHALTTSRTLSTSLTSSQEQLDRSAHVIELRDEELAMLEQKLLQKSKIHQKLVEDLNITKVKIQNLTGIKVKVVARLKEELGDSIRIDPKTGAMRFSSNILFTQGTYALKEDAKQELSQVLHRYIGTLLLDEEMRRYIDVITIEGHTNSDGDYLYNLALSQKRALAVMEFLYSQDFADEELFRTYLSASGRSFADPVLNTLGKEDKDASRRIEITFRIKSEQAVKELAHFLNRSNE